MKKRIAILAVLAMIVAFAVTAYAEYGEWEYITGLNPPGYTNASFLGVDAIDEMNLWTVGMIQTGATDIEYAWKSSDGGYTWDTVYGIGMGADPCDMMKMMSFVIDVEGLTDTTSLFAGFGILDECLEKLEIPWCMFVCMFTLSPMILYTDDGGATLQRATVPFLFGGALNAIDRADETTFFAAGGPDLLLKSTDAGATWTALETLPEGEELFFNDVEFVNANLGFLTTGDSEPEAVRTKAMSDYDYALAHYEHMVSHAQFAKDPIHRIEVMKRNALRDLSNEKGLNGKVFRTTDGGATWEEVLSANLESFLYLNMFNENEGWVMGSPVSTAWPPFSIYRTTDGGATWVDYTDKVPIDGLGNMAFGLSAITFNETGSTGFLGGGGQLGIGYKSVLFYTVDRGETWTYDPTLEDWGHPIISFDWATNKIAFQAGFDMSIYKYTQSNLPPIAYAGDDQEVMVLDMVTLDGSDSYDPDGDAITYEWEQMSGPTVELTGADEAMPTFVATEAGELVFQLTVSDGEDGTSDQVTVTVTEETDDDTIADDDTAADDDVSDDDTGDDDLDVDDDDDDDDDDDTGGCGC